MPEVALVLYELVTANGRSISPFVWRIRCALLHKQLDWQPVYMGFTEPRPKFATFPTLQHQGEMVCGSWLIAEYIEARFGDRPALFETEKEKSFAQFAAAWVDSQLLPLVFRYILLDIHDAARPEDQAYFRETREKRVNDTLEHCQQTQRARGNLLTPALEPARRVLADQDFLDGAQPGYADFCLFSLFQWQRSCSDYNLLEANDPVTDWLASMDNWHAARN